MLFYAASFSGTSFAGVSVSAVQDLFSLKASSAVPFRLRRLSLSVAGVTSPSELIISISRLTGTVTQGSGGSTPTVNELSQLSGRGASTTVHANDTARASESGATQLLWTGTLQELMNLDDVIIPELIPLIAAGDALVIGLEVAPGSAVTMYGTVHFGEEA